MHRPVSRYNSLARIVLLRVPELVREFRTKVTVRIAGSACTAELRRWRIHRTPSGKHEYIRVY